MNKSNFLEIKDEKIILTKPLFYSKDRYSIKHETKNFLLKVRDEVGKCILAFSGGTDSLFLLCAFKDLVEQNKLTKDAFDVIYIDADLSELLIDSIPSTVYKKRIDWILNYFKDYVQVFNIKPTIKSIKDFYRNNKYMTWAGTPVQHFVQSMAKDLFDYPTIESEGQFACEHFNLPNISYWALDKRTSTIHTHLYDINLFCTGFYNNKIPLELNLNNTYSSAQQREIIEFYIKYRRFTDCYPETIYGYPKLNEWRSSFIDMKPATIAFFKNIHPNKTLKLPEYIIPWKERSDQWIGYHPILLPDGNKVISVEQTQEFFNRHS